MQQGPGHLRKPVFGVTDQVKYESAQLQRLVRMLKVNMEQVYISYRKQILKALIRLRGCPGWCVPLFFVCIKVRFSHVGTHIVLIKFKFHFQMQIFIGKALSALTIFHIPD